VAQIRALDQDVVIKVSVERFAERFEREDVPSRP